MYIILNLVPSMVKTEYREPLVLSEARNSIEVFVGYFEWNNHFLRIRGTHLEHKDNIVQLEH